MIKLTVGNSMSRLEGLNAEQLKAIRKLTAYSIDPSAAYFSGSAHSRYRNLMDKKGSFPTGLLYIVAKWLEPMAVPATMRDFRKRPNPLHGLFSLTLPHKPYPEQEAAAEACSEHGRGVVSATTATGKSLMIALTINKLQVTTLVVVPSLELKRQLTEDLRRCFGINVVGGLGSRIAVMNVDALDPKEVLEGYDCVILDEFHHSAAKTYRDLNRKAWAGVYYRLGFTATPFRTQDNERLLLESVLSSIIYRLDYPTAVAKRYIVPVEAYFIDLPVTEIDSHSWPEVYSKLVTKNFGRNMIIAALMRSLQGKSTLCLVKEIAHGRAIQDILMGEPMFATGVDSNTEGFISDFNAGREKWLIGTTGIIGEGVDTKPAEYIIIAGLGKSKTQLMQQIGRGLRLYPGKESCKVILFRDASHKFTLTHFKKQCTVLRDEYGTVPVKLEI